ncbi:eukaryotic aspartyl protease [Nemania abortiva]|nr:eukaryotic aspartyl protease [Nemania abortiva]
MDAIYSTQNEFKKDRGLAKVRAVHNPNYKRHGTRSYVHLLHKYKFEPTKSGPYFWVNRPKQRGLVPEKFRAALGGRVTGERVLVKDSPGSDATHGQVTAEDSQNDMLYLCKVTIGTPPQTLMLDFDTGSADCWVFSSSLSSSQEKNHNKIEYGDGSNASGDCGADTLNIGGLEVKKQTIEMATKLSEQFVSNTGDGLLGLAFSKINTVQDGEEADPQATPVENMIEQDDIPKDAALFTSAFYSSRDGATSKSFYTFGFIDQDLVNSSGQEIHWVEVDNTDGFWAFSSESSSVNGELVPTSSNMAIADTGTTLALMSDDAVDALYAQIPGATYDYANQGYIFPITVKVDDIPDFEVAVGDRSYLIQKEDLAFAPTDDGKNWYGGVQSRGSLPFDILGDTFLKSVYAVSRPHYQLYKLCSISLTHKNLRTGTGTGKGEADAEADNNAKTKVSSVTMAAADFIDPISVPL